LAVVNISTDAAKDKQQREKVENKERTFSKFNELSVALAVALTGLVVVYLPGTLNKSFDWAAEGRIIGAFIGVFGACFALFAAASLTDREGLKDLGGSVLVGGASIGMIFLLHHYRMFAWAAMGLIALTILFIFIAIYALVAGFTSFFDDHGVRPSREGADSGSKLAESGEAELSKQLSGYDRTTLIVALVSGIATVAAAVEPLVH
jgi:hypothetical protein